MGSVSEFGKGFGKFQKPEPASSSWDDRPVFNPLKPNQSVIFNGKQAKHSSMPQPQDVTVQVASILRSRIPASLKGKQIQGTEGIHGGHKKNGFTAPQALEIAASGRAPPAS